MTVLVPAVLVLVGASSAFGQYPPANPSGYRVIPAPESTPAFLGTARSFNWVDNDRLLFAANDRELSTTKKDKERTVRITRGIVEEMSAASPDGSRVAVITDP